MRKLLVFTIVLFIATGCKKEQSKNEQKTEEKTSKQVTNEKAPSKSFTLKAPEPVNGKLKGVVELGSSGFNSFIVDIDKNKNWKVKKKEFGNSLIAEGMTNPKEVNTKLRDYIQKIVEYGVNGKDVHFVVSSGARKEKIAKIIIDELKKIGYNVNVVNPREEAQYAFKSALPNRFQQMAFATDIGSGNTKVSYIEDGKIKGEEAYGAKYYQKKVNDATAYKNVKANASRVPKDKRRMCFIIGGVPYQMAKKSRKGDERYTVLSTDIASYAELAENKGEKVKCGLNIYKAIIDETKCKKFIFDWDANFTIGFLLDLPY